MFSPSLHSKNRRRAVPNSNLMVFRIVVPLLCCPMATDLVVDVSETEERVFTLTCHLPAGALNLGQLLESGQIELTEPSPPLPVPVPHLRLERA